jgi:hypothetical protein
LKSSFVAYIDESGDEGFKFLDNERGSSRWFVVSAAVFRRENDLQAVKVLKATRELLGKPPKYALHFKEMKHDARVAYVTRVAEAHFRHVSVLVHKPSLAEPERFQESPYMLYRYATRLLLERVSWLCRDARKPDGCDGTVEAIFSDRSAMSYDDLRQYLCMLRDQSLTNDSIRIDWDVIKPELARAVKHDQLAGLQVADAVASSVFAALNKTPLGNTEPRYLTILKRQTYRHKGVALGYGLKVWPPQIEQLEKEMPHMAALRDI